MKITWFLAWRYLFRQSERHISFISIASVLGVTLGVATLVVVISVMNGFDQDLAGKLLQFHHHLIVETSYPSLLDEAQEKIEAIPEVTGASIFVQTQVFGEFGDYIVPLLVRGIDFSDVRERELLNSFIKEEFSSEGFFIGEELKNRFVVGNSLTFYPLRKKIKSDAIPIRGTFSVGIYDIDNNYLIGNIAEVKALGPYYLQYLGVRLKDPWEAEEVKTQINRLGLPLTVSTWIDTNRMLFSALKLEKITMFVILSLIILVATFSIFSLLMVKVVEKTKEIGILRALGFTSGAIRRIFTLQGIVLGGVGMVSGLGVGVGLCILIRDSHLVTIPKEIYFIDYLPVHIAYGDMILIGVVCMALSFAASIIPALRAGRLAICRALRYE
ncbi:MAG: ABC transporter permease [Candidatus Omnitrophica bacterium]|nr:ABC transporter permease [Candidatus Omnitrophota bacterium]